MAAALALGGCGDIERLKVALDDRIVKVDSKKPIDLHRTGVAFLSLGSSEPKCRQGVFEIFFKPLDGSLPEMRFDAVTSNVFGVSDAVMRTEDSCVELVGMSLPPGKYRISESKWFYDMGMQTVRVDHNYENGVQFEVKAGEATYLGSFQMTFFYDKNLFGKTTMAGGRYSVRDDLQHDKQKLDQMRPELATLPVNEQLPPDDNGPDGFPRIARRDTSS